MRISVLRQAVKVVAAAPKPVGHGDAEVRLAVLRIAALGRLVDDRVRFVDHRATLLVALLQQLNARAQSRHACERGR